MAKKRIEDTWRQVEKKMLLKFYQLKEQDCAVWPLNTGSPQTLQISTDLPRMLPRNRFELIFPVGSSIQGFLFQSCNHIFLFFVMHYKVSGLWEKKHKGQLNMAALCSH